MTVNSICCNSSLYGELNSKSKNGFIGKCWNCFKNITHIGAGSNKAKKAIFDFENGKITQDEMNNALSKYYKGQEQCVDMFADIVSGIAAFGAFAIATGLGIAASPFTGGASLGLVAAGIGIAGAVGAGVKIGIKKLDCFAGGRKYDSLGYDLATGGINGIFAPISAGIGGAAGKAVAGKIGVTVLNSGGEVAIKEAIEGTTRGILTRTLLTTNVNYLGGTVATRTLAFGADMAVNGTITGSVDSGVRYIAGDSENKTISGFVKEVGTGALGGLVIAPVIGGGMRLTGMGVGKLTDKVKTKISTIYSQAEAANMNMPKIDNPDAEAAKTLAMFISHVRTLFERTKGKQILISEDSLDISQVKHIIDVLESSESLKQEVSALNEALPNTKIYKHLGILPKRVKRIFSTFKSEIEILNELAGKTRRNLLIESSDAYDKLIKKYNDRLLRLNTKIEYNASMVAASTIRSRADESASVLIKRLLKLLYSKKFQSMTREEQLQALMESSNILFAKFAQTYSSSDTLPPEITQIFKKFTSNCAVSRNMSEAQRLADELYGAGKYTIKKSFGAGTIGETYLAVTASGEEVVIKMLKEGITPERFAEDRAILTRYINEFVTDEVEKEYRLNMINGMFDAWDRELDFALEAEGARMMALNARRFRVAQTLEIGTKGGQNISLVMEKADGIRLDTLLEMIKLYRSNPTEYFEKYANEIMANPVLKNPELWIKRLGREYQRAQNEQVWFVGKNGTKAIHADPHSGNIFVSFDVKTGKPHIIYIDTGNVITRTHAETLQDICLSLNMLFGNSQGTAETILNGAIFPKNSDKNEIIRRFAQLLDERLFKADVNLQDPQYTQNIINGIMEELNIIPSSSNANLIKATVQRMQTLQAIHNICGTPLRRGIDVNDLAIGILESLKINPIATLKEIRPIIKWAYKNNDQAMKTFFQMIISTVRKSSTNQLLETPA